jgi:rifampicin phosphotransferase
MLPVGSLVAHATRWTGASNAEVLDLLRGSTPVSLGIAERELQAVGATLREAGLGPESFPETRSAASIVESLRARTDAVGEAVRAFLDVAGSHLAGGYDVSFRTLAEMPELVLESFWQAHGGFSPRTEAERGRLDEIRSRVPEAHRSEFDALLREARLVSRLRDERGLYNDLWAAGISRLALVETGRRLAVRGRLDDESLVLDAELGEIVGLLEGALVPTSCELAARARKRGSVRLEDVPPVLGDAPMPPPPLDGLPPQARLAAEAIGVAIDEILGGASDPSDAHVIRGKAASPGTYEGRARVVHGPEDFDRVSRGDVLVMTSTSASINVLLPVIGAIVTDRGGLLSHAAIVAREYGIPGVVGTSEATKRIADGARVRVDGSQGTVEVLS